MRDNSASEEKHSSIWYVLFSAPSASAEILDFGAGPSGYILLL